MILIYKFEASDWDPGGKNQACSYGELSFSIRDTSLSSALFDNSDYPLLMQGSIWMNFHPNFPVQKQSVRVRHWKKSNL